MATVECKALAGQKTHSRWGHLEFNAQGQCEVDDAVGQQIADAAVQGFQVYGLPSPEADDDIDSESLEDDTSEDDAGESEGDEGGDDHADASDDIDNESLDDASPETPKAKKSKKVKLGKKKSK